MLNILSCSKLDQVCSFVRKRFYRKSMWGGMITKFVDDTKNGVVDSEEPRLILHQCR